MEEAKPTPALDVRTENEFRAGHLADSVNIPLAELTARVYELPERGSTIRLVQLENDADAEAQQILEGRGFQISIVAAQRHELTEVGTSTNRLWQPNPFLVEAVESILLREQLVKGHRALDVACGTGRDAVYLAMNGYEVDAIDILPDALDRANNLASHYGVQIRTIRQDLERQPVLPVGKYGLVIVFRYLQRSLMPALAKALAPGGYLVYETFHERNRQTGAKPANPDHLLKTGELKSSFSELEVLIADDAFERNGRYFSHIVARRREKE